MQPTATNIRCFCCRSVLGISCSVTLHFTFGPRVSPPHKKKSDGWRWVYFIVFCWPLPPPGAANPSYASGIACRSTIVAVYCPDACGHELTACFWSPLHGWTPVAGRPVRTVNQKPRNVRPGGLLPVRADLMVVGHVCVCRSTFVLVYSFSVPTTLWVKKTKHLTLAHNFTKYWPIFKILSLLDSVGNL